MSVLGMCLAALVSAALSWFATKKALEAKYAEEIAELLEIIEQLEGDVFSVEADLAPRVSAKKVKATKRKGK